MTTHRTTDPDPDTSDSAVAIDVADVFVTLGSTPVLSDVSLTVDRGEFVGLVGPNGAGKTTLLQCLSGVRTPDEGSIRIDGSALDALGSRETSRRVAVVPQDTTLNFDFTVRDVIAMGRTPHRGRFERATTEDRRIVDDAMARTSVESFADSSIRAVSGGERQRVILARALAQEAPILLLDEPTASLDVNHQIRTLDLVEDLVAQGRTAVAAIHDLSLAARYCDRLVLLADGEIVTTGAPAEVLTRTTVAEAFDADAAVTTDPVTGSPAVTPLSARTDERDANVHVLGTGPTASETVTALDAAGITVTAGPAPSGDAVASTADGLNLTHVTTPPFRPPDGDAREAVEAAAAAADVVALAGTIPPGALDILPPTTQLVAIPPIAYPVDEESAASTSDRPQLDDVPRFAPDSIPSAIESDASVPLERIGDTAAASTGESGSLADSQRTEDERAPTGPRPSNTDDD
jgi:iron complex transport system ATP-binding protein